MALHLPGMSTTFDITQDLEDWLTPQEVAALLKFKTARPVYAAIQSGELAAISVWRQFRVSRSDLVAFINQHRLHADYRTEPPTVSKPKPGKRGRSAAAVLGER
jgi:excisionase family DNA binding protein